MAKQKRFSPKELAEWMYKAAHEAISDKEIGTTYYKIVGGGLAVILCWSQYDSYQYEENNPFMRPTKIRKWVGDPYMQAHCLEVSLRIANSSYFVDDWEYAIQSQEGDIDGETSLDVSDENDKCRSTAAWLSKLRTEVLKHHRG